MYNRLAPSTRGRYEGVAEEFGEFLEIHNKSLWDADFEDLKKFLLEAEIKKARSMLSTFYRVLIDSGEFKSENPVVQLNKIEREQRQKEEGMIEPPSRAETVLQELDESKDLKQTRLATTERRQIGKRILTLDDLDVLIQQANHIRDRAILEFLYATGAQIKEVINLNLSDVDLDARQVVIQDSSGDEYRVLILPKRTVSFLKIYERWRRRQMSPSQAYFITKTTRKRMSDSSISTWLNRIQGDVSDLERWTAMDFRKRALLQHYWITRDLTAVARFGGYKRAESALNLISDVLADQGVDSIDKLVTLPEFEELKSEGRRVASVGSDDGMTITIQLDKDEMDIIRNSGLTPTQAVKTVISLKDLIGGGGGGLISSGGPSSSGPSSSGPSSGPTSSGPGSGPKMSAPGSGPNLSTGPSSGPNLSSSPKAGPNLSSSPKAGPNLSSSPKAGPDLSSSPNAGTPAKPPGGPPKGAPPGGPGGPPGGGGGGGPMGQLQELKQILARRRKMSEEKPPEEKEDSPSPAGLGGTIEDTDTSPSSSASKDDDDDEDDVDDIPDLNI